VFFGEVITMNTQEFKRKLSAIFSADVAGYSRLMGEDEAATVRTLEAYKEIMFSLIKQHRGRVIDSPGDNLLAEFASVVDAVQCAVAVQKELEARNADLPETRKMRFRIGINLGDVIEEGDRIYGDGVNIAARLESCADPGGICVSKTAFDHIETKLPLGYEFLGEQQVKNIAKPVGAYRVLMDPRVTVAGAKGKKPIPLWRRKGILVGAMVILIVIAGILIYRENTPPTPTLPRRGGGKSTTSYRAELREDFHARGRQLPPVMNVWHDHGFCRKVRSGNSPHKGCNATEPFLSRALPQSLRYVLPYGRS
jgi:class 3 adenylate cyclase